MFYQPTSFNYALYKLTIGLARKFRKDRDFENAMISYRAAKIHADNFNNEKNN